jgi:hypothetical protein
VITREACATSRIAIDGDRLEWIFLPRPWMSIDDAQVTRSLEMECASIGRIDSEVFVRGRLRQGDRMIELPYWHKAVRI